MRKRKREGEIHTVILIYSCFIHLPCNYLPILFFYTVFNGRIYQALAS